MNFPLWLPSSLFLLSLVAIPPIQAQIVRDTTLPNRSVVTPKGKTNVITGGTQKGTNLFHSFQQFSIPAGEAASFQHNSGIANIFSRVTSSKSEIRGLIEVLETSGKLSSANFFLINPKGILFGPNASLNLGGSFVASTASSLKFANSTEFSATNPNSPSPLLTVSVPLGLQFGATPGSIVNEPPVDGSGVVTNLAVQPGRTLALVGGKIDLDGGLLFAPDGRIELGSVAGSGLVGLNPIDFALDYKDIQAFQDIRLLGGATVGVVSDAGGDVTIAARNLQVQDGSQVGSVAFAEGGEGTLTVKATDAIELTGASANGKTESALLSVIQGNEGIGSNLVISTPQLVIRDGARIFSVTTAQGQGGNITVIADSIKLSGTAILSGDVSASGIFALTQSSGNGGNITIDTKQLDVQQGAQVLTSTTGSGLGGNLTVTADNSVTVIGHSLEGFKKSDRQGSDFANITISGLLTQADVGSTGPAGQLKIKTGQLRVLDGAQINSVTFAQGSAGSMQVQASNVKLAGVALLKDGQVIPSYEEDRLISPFIASGLLASADEGSKGSGGPLLLETQRLSLRDGAVLQTSTLGSGDAGELTIRGLNSPAADSIEVIGTVKGGLYPTSIQALSGGLPDLGLGSPEATGKGGTLGITTDNLTVRDGAQLAVSSLNSTSAAKGAGNIQIQAANILLDNRGQLSARTASGTGGSITLQAQDLLLLRRNSQISTSAGTAQAGGDGGNITINDRSNPRGFVVAVPSENSDITANAFEGKGGFIQINAQGVFGLERREQLTPLSDITAFSEQNSELNGVVEINTPDVDPSQGLTELPDAPVNVEVAQGCQVGGKQASVEFFNTGKGGLAPSPYEPLSSSEIWEDLSLPTQATATPSATPRASTNSPTTLPNQIIEAKGWLINEKGEVTLVAEVPHRQSQQGCHLR